MNKTYLVDYINLFDKVYAITINDANELNFLESYLEGDTRKYKVPNLDTSIIDKTREELVEINKNNLMKAFVDYLNENMKNGVYKNKEELLADINRFKEFINSDYRLRDYLYFQEALEQVKADNNINEMLNHFEQKYAKSEEVKEVQKEDAKEEAKEYIETNNISQATLEDGTKIAVSNNENNKSATVIQLNKNEELEDVIAETKVDGDYNNTHEVIQTMANQTHISAESERPDELDKDDSLATQVAYHENKYNDGDMIAVVNSNHNNNFADNVVIDRKTGNISEVSSYEDGSLYLNGTNQDNYSTTSDSINATNTQLKVENIEVSDDNNPIPEFESLESLYNSDQKEEWTNKVEYLYEINREKWEEYMAYHEERQNELAKDKAPQKKLGQDPRAAFIDISIIALTTSIIGTISLLAILIKLM